MKATEVTPAQLKLLQLVLGGGSVIDWNDLDMDEPGRVEKFLTLNAFDITAPFDRRRLKYLVRQSVIYLTNELEFPLSSVLRSVTDPRQLFYIASGRHKNPRQGMEACALLKVCHIINHLEGRQLLFHLPVEVEVLYDLLRERISEALSRLKEKGVPLARFTGDTKTAASMTTKLLAKKETIAAGINDRLRFRLITPSRTDIVPLILALFEDFLPFNYVIPGESANDLLPLPQKSHSWPSPLALARKTLSIGLHAAEEKLGLAPRPNTFSGETYRIVQFVVDVPLHLGEVKGAVSARLLKDYGAVVYTKVEFQIVDRKTETANNEGENSHDRYKRRQRIAVLKRLVES